jgi:hypothetical protein
MHRSNARNLSVCYLYLKLAKMLCFSYYLLCILFNKIGEQEGGTGFAWKWVEEEVQIMYTHVSKCKKDKIKLKKEIVKHLEGCRYFFFQLVTQTLFKSAIPVFNSSSRSYS